MTDQDISITTPKKSGFKKFLRWFLLILFISISISIYWKYYFTYSKGLQGGKMQKISSKGNIFKTWEGYLLISISVDNNSFALTTQQWAFSVQNDSIAHVLENYEGKMVKVRYEQKHGTLPWRGDTPYLIYEVVLDQ